MKTHKLLRWCQSLVVLAVLTFAAASETYAAPAAPGAVASAAPAAPGAVASPSARRVQAIGLFRDGNRPEALEALHKARVGYETMVVDHPDSIEAARGLAMTLFDLGDYEAARAVFERMRVLEDARIGQELPVVAADGTATSVVAEVVQMPAYELAPNPAVLRGIDVHPNILFEDTAEGIEKNIMAFVHRAAGLGVNTVFAHAFTKPNAKGAYAAAYFDTGIVPTRAEILRPLAEALALRGIAVYAVMPMLSFDLTETDSNNSMMVMSKRMGRPQPSGTWRQRLSPFNTNAVALVSELYHDLAVSVPLNGIVFGDDGYLTDEEDLNPEAIQAYAEALGSDLEGYPLNNLMETKVGELSEIKRERLDAFAGQLMETFRAEQPDARFIRTLYAPAVMYPASEAWMAQNYAKALDAYDGVLILADPELEEARARTSWTRELSEGVVATSGGPERTILRIPAYSGEEDRWLPERTQAKMVKTLRKAGLQQFIIGPDDFYVDRPRFKQAKRVFEVES